MNSISILHCADMHLGCIVSAFDREKNNTRMKEIEYTCMSVLDDAKNFDVVLLSGDIFDSADVSSYICNVFLNKIKSMPDVYFFYSCGNHDQYISKTTEYLILNCPDNLHIFGYECVECVTIESLNTRVYGVSFKDAFQSESMLFDIENCDSSYINLMCVHGELAESSVYNPINISSLSKKHFDYVALGHIHKYSGIQKLGEMYYAYSGNPEPNGFDELGNKGYISGKISKDIKHFDFISVSKREYHNVYVDISDCNDYLSVINKINDEITSVDYIWRIFLNGENNTGVLFDVELIKRYVNAFHVEIIDETTLQYDLDNLSRDLTLLGLCAKMTLDKTSKCSEEEKQVYDDAFSVLYSLFQEGGNDNDKINIYK